MINVVIPMAGEGSRFVQGGYSTPKPFISVSGKPMIVRVMENLNIPNAKFILIVREEHMLQEAELVEEIKKNYNVVFIPISKLTEGTACTVLYARKFINNKVPLLIANSDQIVDININEYINNSKERDLDGSILCFIDLKRDIKYSFAKIDENELVTEVKEKVGISDYATVGIYYFEQGKYFVNGAIDMIVENDRTNGEFYTCPAYNYLIKDEKKIGIYNIKINDVHMIGTPEDLNIYLNSKERIN